MTQKIIKFHFNSPLHIGSVRQDYGISEKMLHSDSIYSAIISVWATLGHDILEKDKGTDLGFTISSLFPFYQKSEISESTYFFSRPLGIIQHKNSKERKDIKKIQYLDFTSFQEVLQGNFEANTKNIKGSFYLKDIQDFDEKFIQSEVYARNAVPRDGGDATIYYIDRLFFGGHSGLFCMAQFENTEIANKVMGALRYLQDEGIGTDRHVGNGLFEMKVEEDEQTLQSFENLVKSVESDYALNLSLFCPESKDGLQNMLDENAQYEIIKRGGWISTEPYLSYRKKSIYMFKEGSIFKTDSSSKGKTVDLKPKIMENTDNEHSIYRVGKSLFVPIKLE